MDDIDRYLDLGYSGIAREAQTETGETVVCRDRLRRCFRLVTVRAIDSRSKPYLKIERKEIISESRYRKSVVEFGILDNEAHIQGRNQRRMARIAAQHELNLMAPICPLCGHKMDVEDVGQDWLCARAPECQGRRGSDGRILRYLELKQLIA
jgi:hypothetical protein